MARAARTESSTGAAWHGLLWKSRRPAASNSRRQGTELRERRRQEALEKLEAAVPQAAKKAGIKYRCEVLEGRAVDTILAHAEDEKSELIVLGASGHSAVTRWLLGSTAERVVRHAHCAVLITH